MRSRRLVLSAIVSVVVVGLWWMITAIHAVSTLILPTPAATWSALGSTLTDSSEVYLAVDDTVRTIGVAFLAGAAIGVLLGQLIGRSQLLRDAYEPLIANLTAVPLIVIYPMLVGALGVTALPKVLIGGAAALLPTLLASIAAAHAVDPTLVTAVQALGGGRWQRATSVVLPSGVPALFSGMRTGLGLCAVTVVAAEYIASLGGLGYHLAQSSQSLRTPELFAYLIVTLVVMGLLNIGLAGVQLLVNKGVNR